TRKNFVADQRPWVGVDDPIPSNLRHDHDPDKNVVHLINRRVRWHLDIVNYGKSPALHTYASGLVLVGRAPDPHNEEAFAAWIQREVSSRKPARHMRPFILMPNVSGQNFIDPSSTRDVDQGEFDRLLKQDAGFVLLGQIEYQDTFGNPYVTELCEFRFATGA